MFLFFTLCFRAFGDKSNPPSLPDVESEGEEVNEEVDESKEQTEEQCTDGDTTEQVCSTVEELSLTEPEEEKDEKAKTGEEEEEAENEDQKMTQGITMSKSLLHMCLVKTEFPTMKLGDVLPHLCSRIMREKQCTFKTN